MENLQLHPFSVMLSEFNALIHEAPSKEKIKNELMKISDAAAINSGLNSNQKDAIMARCRNYLNGTYGKPKPLSSRTQ
jgi:hypothetical protein